jgi:hypothetical protein
MARPTSRPWSAFKEEQAQLKPLPTIPYDSATITTVRASKQFRVTLDTNRYSVPAEYASTRLMLKTYPDRACLYHQDQLIARHPRLSDRYQDFEDPDHPRELLVQRRNAREQKLMMRFLTLSPKAQAYYQALEQRRLNPRHHVRKIVALSVIYGQEKVAPAIEGVFASKPLVASTSLISSKAVPVPSLNPASCI